MSGASWRFAHNLPVQQRAEKLRNAINDNRLGDALSLLVIAEESLHKWQRLNLARIESTQPEQLLRAIDEARDLVDHHLREDLHIYQHAKQILDRFAKSEAIDGFRFLAVRELAKQRCALRDELDSFAKARQHQVETWEDFHVPSLLDAAFATIEAAATTTNRVLAAVGRGLVSLGAQLAQPLWGRHTEERPNVRQGKDSQCQADSAGLERNFPDSAGPLAWCRSQGFDRDHCTASLGMVNIPRSDPRYSPRSRPHPQRHRLSIRGRLAFVVISQRGSDTPV